MNVEFFDGRDHARHASDASAGAQRGRLLREEGAHRRRRRRLRPDHRARLHLRQGPGRGRAVGGDAGEAAVADQVRLRVEAHRPVDQLPLEPRVSRRAAGRARSSTPSRRAAPTVAVTTIAMREQGVPIQKARCVTAVSARGGAFPAAARALVRPAEHRGQHGQPECPAHLGGGVHQPGRQAPSSSSVPAMATVISTGKASPAPAPMGTHDREDVHEVPAVDRRHGEQEQRPGHQRQPRPPGTLPRAEPRGQPVGEIGPTACPSPSRRAGRPARSAADCSPGPGAGTARPRRTCRTCPPR